MIAKFAEMKAQLAELASVLNTFKSEAVQLRLLELLFDEQQDAGTGAPPKAKEKPQTSQRRKGKKKTAAKADTTPSNPNGKKKAAATGSGPNATLNQLAAGTFFDKPRTINDIIVHCKDNMARTFKANEFSGKLGRMVRDNELTRKKNADNQYEYKKA